MRAVIAGSRYFDDYPFMNKVLRHVFLELQAEGYPIERELVEIVTGKQKGAEGLARLYSDVNKLELKIIYADADSGANGYYSRNKNMIEYANEDEDLGVLIAFHDGVSTITEDLIKQAQLNNVRTYVYKQ